MNYKYFFHIAVLVLLTINSKGQYTLFPQTSLGLWIVHNNAGSEPECRAFKEFAMSMGFREILTTDTEELLRKPKLLKGIDILWALKNDTMPLTSVKEDKVVSVINDFVKQGGKVVLVNQAAGLIHAMGLEQVNPENHFKQSIDEGYGRQLGYHAFRDHPLFQNMNGGAYVLKPIKDTAVFVTGYFNDSKPSRGRVIAVDWDYIFLREESKIIIEYQEDKGKVLAIGGYLLYSMPNRNRIHLETFTKNIFRYLTQNTLKGEYHYWNQEVSTTIKTPFQISQPIPISGPSDLTFPEQGISILPGISAGNYWDLAGERMLLMGNDHGGITEIWAHPALSLRDYTIRYIIGDNGKQMENLGSLRPEIEILPASYSRKYNLTGDLKGPFLSERITVSPDKPLTLVNYQYSGNEPIELEISFQMLFRLMWPYSEKVLGNLHYCWNNDLLAFIATDQSADFVTIIGVGKKGDGISVKSSDTNNVFEMPSRSGIISLQLSGPGSFNVIIASSCEGIDSTLRIYLQALANPASVFNESQEQSESLVESSLMIRSPDNNFNEAYQWALLAADRFQVTTPGVGSSLVAGYATSDKGWDGEHAVSGRPGYGWYFGRDGVWSGFALLHYGNFEIVRLMLQMFHQYQDLSGKIYHELSTSGVVHYDASDATPLYIILAGRYLRHSGDTAFIRSSWPYLIKAIDFCYSTDTDGDRLIENTNVGHGWVEGGHLFGSHTSLYLASCWAAALDEAAYMASILNLEEKQSTYAMDAREIKQIINRDFWFEQNDYYYHGLMPDGSYMEETSIMPAIPLLFGQADRDQAIKVMQVIAANSFTTDWGCRIVQENDPRFNPRGYHTGTVWPLFTGWAAMAEFRNGNYLQGFSHLASNMQIWKYWGLGFMEEVLNGEFFQPAGVCHHQCWSETMTVQPVIEGMLGYRPDAPRRTMNLNPWFPANWDTVSVMNIRLGDEKVGMETWKQEILETGKQGSGETWRQGSTGAGFVSTYKFMKSSAGRIGVNLKPALPPGCKVGKITVNGQPAKDWGVREADQGWVIPDFGFWLDSLAVVEISWQGGIAALPLISDPQPGEKSKGFRILNTRYANGAYIISLQAPRASQQEFKVWAAEPDKYIAESAVISGISGNIITLTTEFPDVETDYAVKTVVIR